MKINWAEVAKAADEGLPAILGRLHSLQESGELVNWVIAFEWKDQSGEHYSHECYSDPTSGLGLLEIARRAILKSYIQMDD